MPGDLLRYLSGPTGFPGWWWLVAAGCLLVPLGWFLGLYIWTLPPARLRRTPLLAGVHRRLLRRRFARAITAAAADYRAGQLSRQQAATQINRTLRAFLHLATGARAQYLTLDDILGHSEVRAAAPVLEALTDAQFCPDAVDLGRVAHQAVAVIRTWT